jgi:hypothetical protein
MRRHRQRFLPLVVLAAAAALLGGCSPTAIGSPTAGPVASGGTTCRTAPTVGTVPGWETPATPPSKPDRTAKVALYDLGRDPTKPVATADGTFIWAIQNERGVYVATVTFPEAGTYGAEFTTSVAGGPAVTIRTTFSVDSTTSLVRIGQQAPSTKTPTATDAGGDLSHISSDTTPDPAFYKTSEDQALASHQAFVLIFATPKFCQSAQCGPTLDRIKPFVAKYPTVDFIHVEPYELQLQGGALQPVMTNNALTPTSVSNAWGLSSEPWVFVVDRQGIVRGSFGLIFSDAELTGALDAVK